MFFLSQLKYDVVTRKKPELLRRLKTIIGREDVAETPDSYDHAAAEFLESRLHQGTVSGNLWYMLNQFSDEPSDELPEDMLAMHLVERIIANRAEICRNIEQKCR